MEQKQGFKTRTQVRAGRASDYQGCKLFPADGPLNDDNTDDDASGYINIPCTMASTILSAYFKNR